jgi:hypothetical protein
MASELRYLQQRYAEATFDRTWQGRLFVLMRHATGFYCIFRSLVVRSRKHTLHAFSHSRQSLSNIFLPASHPTAPRPDLLASTLLRFVPHPSLVTEANITYATRQANLVLVGAIIIGSIRRVLHGAARALRATPASRNRVASLVLLVLAQLMVCLSHARAMPMLNGRRVYTSSRRSCSSARRSPQLWTARIRGYSQRYRLMRRLGLCLIGASLRALDRGLSLSG